MSHRDDISPEIYADAIGDEDFFVGPHPRKHWTPSAVYCHFSQADCSHCYNHVFYGLNDVQPCHMPKAIDVLLGQGAVIPKTMMSKLSNYVFSGTLETGHGTGGKK